MMNTNFVGKPLCRVMMAVAIMLLSLQAMAYNFSYTYQGKTLYYNFLSGNTVEVTHRYNHSSNYVNGHVVIPSYVVYNNTTYNVKSVGQFAFSGCNGVTSIIIPNSVTSIKERAFADCSNLTSVTIPNSVTYIERGAFANCSGLTSVTIPSSVHFIGEELFSGCSNLTSVTIPSSITSIGNHAFAGCSNLTSVTIPNSVTSIGNNTFRDCSGLMSVTIGNSVTSIGYYAFYNCSNLTTLNFNAINCHEVDGSIFNGSSLTTANIGDSVKRIPTRLLAGCDSLTTLNFNAINCQDFEINDYYHSGPFGISLTMVNIGDSVRKIPNNFVRGCSSLISVTIPNSVTFIGSGAFYGCSDLTSISIPNSVTFIGSYAFLNCSGLTSINVASGNTHYSSIDGVLYSYIQDTLIQCPGAKTSVTIPNSVTSIGNSAFYGCSGLTSVTIPNSVTSIGNSAFYGCSGFTMVTIPNNITSIGVGAFIGCNNLTILNFNAFVCQDLGVIYNNGNYYSSFGTSLTTVNIGDNVRKIPNNFVRGCSDLTSVTIGNSVMYIGDYAFYDCNNLLSLVSLATIPPTICDEAFPYPNVCVVTVPCGSLESYTTSTCRWGVFFPGYIQEDCASSLQEVNAREFALYPNPAKSFVNLEFEALKENTLLKILDINGRRVRTFDLKAGVETLRIDLGDLPKGVYTIMLGNTTKKLIVE